MSIIDRQEIEISVEVAEMPATLKACVEYTYTPRLPETRTDPEEPADVFIYAVRIGDTDISDTILTKAQLAGIRSELVGRHQDSFNLSP